MNCMRVVLCLLLPVQFLFAETTLKELYQKNLEGVSFKDIKVEKISGSFVMSGHGLEKEDYNDSLYWALNEAGERVIGFRPIATRTGCDSGCNDVIFHLKIDREGKVLDIIQDEQIPLSKLYHEPFSKADIQRAIGICQLLPELLQTVSRPQLLTEEKADYVHQTHTLFKDVLVPKAAYTSYRLFEAALKTSGWVKRQQGIEQEPLAEIQQLKELTQLPDDKKIEESEGAFGYREHFSALLRTDSAKYLANINKGISILDDSKFNASVKAQVYDYLNEALFVLLNEDANQSDLLVRFFSRPEFKTSHRDYFCDLFVEARTSANGRNFILNKRLGNKSLPVCHEKLEVSVGVLASMVNQDWNKLKQIVANVTESDIEEEKVFASFMYEEENFENRLIEAFKAVDRADLARPLLRKKYDILQYFDSLPAQVQGPAIDYVMSLIDNKGISPKYLEPIVQELTQNQSLEALNLTVYPIDGRTYTVNTNAPVVLPEARLDAQAVILFSPGCGHCKQFIKEFKAMLQPQNAEHQLILSMVKFVWLSHVQSDYKSNFPQARWCGQIFPGNSMLNCSHAAVPDWNQLQALYQSKFIQKYPTVAITSRKNGVNKTWTKTSSLRKPEDLIYYLRLVQILNKHE